MNTVVVLLVYKGEDNMWRIKQDRRIPDGYAQLADLVDTTLAAFHVKPIHIRGTGEWILDKVEEALAHRIAQRVNAITPREVEVKFKPEKASPVEPSDHDMAGGLDLTPRYSAGVERPVPELARIDDPEADAAPVPTEGVSAGVVALRRELAKADAEVTRTARDAALAQRAAIAAVNHRDGLRRSIEKLES